jgi:uncharacterized protein (UPF0332 family)
MDWREDVSPQKEGGWPGATPYLTAGDTIRLRKPIYDISHRFSASIRTRGLRLRKHQAVIGEFGRLFAPSGVVDAEFHRYLIDDFDLRNAAEYDPIPEPPITLNRVAEALEHAAEFLAMAENFLEGTGGSIE